MEESPVAHTTAGTEETLVGVDLGGTKIASALVSTEGEVLGEVLEVATPAKDGPEVMLDAIAGLIERVCAAGLDRAPGTLVRPVAVGIGAAGVIDSARGVVVSATDAITGWTGTDVSGGVASRLRSAGLTGPDGGPLLVHVDNDVNAYAAGETWRGAGAGRSSALVVAVGTGVGGAVVLGERVLHGAHSIAGEIGHVPAVGGEGERCTCGREGHLEALSAGPQIARRYREAVGQGVDTSEVVGARDVERLAQQGDAVAQRVYHEAAVALGKAIAGVATVLDPEVVIISGGLARSGDLWWVPLRHTVAAELLDIAKDLPLVPALLGVRAPIIGSAHEADLRRRDKARLAPKHLKETL